MKQWFVAHTQPSKEMLAQKNLVDQGFNVYLPRYKKIRRHARKVEEILSPLFPRYLFVEMDLEVDRWRSVNGTRGISYLLMQEERPISVSTVVIGDLKGQEIDEGIVPLHSMVSFIKGDKVRVLEGIFEGQVVTFEGLDDKQRVRLLLSFLGREMNVSLPLSAVEAA
jgi:transcriptional antiterminator RfaH